MFSANYEFYKLNLLNVRYVILDRIFAAAEESPL